MTIAMKIQSREYPGEIQSMQSQKAAEDKISRVADVVYIFVSSTCRFQL